MRDDGKGADVHILSEVNALLDRPRLQQDRRDAVRLPPDVLLQEAFLIDSQRRSQVTPLGVNAHDDGQFGPPNAREEDDGEAPLPLQTDDEGGRLKLWVHLPLHSDDVLRKGGLDIGQKTPQAFGHR